MHDLLSAFMEHFPFLTVCYISTSYCVEDVCDTLTISLSMMSLKKPSTPSWTLSNRPCSHSENQAV